MFQNKRKMILTVLLAFVIAACSGESTPDPTISAAIALTVAAQNTASANTATPSASQTPSFTSTPLQFAPTLTQAAPPSPTLSGYAAKSACAKASLVSETIPDGTIFK